MEKRREYKKEEAADKFTEKKYLYTELLLGTQLPSLSNLIIF